LNIQSEQTRHEIGVEMGRGTSLVTTPGAVIRPGL